MGFRDAFIIRQVIVPSAEKGTAKAAQAESAPSGQGVFLSGQSLLSFPVASGVVGFLWKLVQHFWPKVGDIAVLYLSITVGIVIFLIVISDPNARPKTALNWLISVAIAILNSLFLAATVLGLAKDVFGSSPAGK